MDEGQIIDEVRRVIRDLSGVVDVLFLDHDLKEKIISMERDAEQNGAAGGLMPFKNIGVWESLSRDVSMVIIYESDTEVLGSDEQPVIMVDEEGKTIGEFVNETKRQELEGKEGVYFLSDDFAIYSDKEVKGDPYFIMPTLEFNDIEGTEGITRIVAGSISTISDHFIRKHMGYENTMHWTHLIGFDLGRE